MKAYIVLNPVAGNCDVEAVQAALDRHLGSAEIAYQVYETSGQERMAEVLRSAITEGFDTFVAAGGDGTVSGVVDGLVHTGLPLGILPVGTANTVARELEIPLDLDQALRLVIGAHATTRIDVGQIGACFFALNASVGISASAMRATRSEEKRWLGMFAYFGPGIKVLLGAQPNQFEVEADGHLMRCKASEVVVANGGAVGDPMLRWGPDVRMDDGELDLCVVRARSVLDYVVLAWNLLRGGQRRDNRLICLRVGHSALIRAKNTMLVQADGEIVGKTPVRIEVVPQAVEVIVPTSSKGETGGQCAI